MENVNPSSPLESPDLFRNREIFDLDALLESLNLTAPPLEKDFSYLEGDVRFVELFKKYEIGDRSEGETKDEEEVVEVEEVGVEYFDKFPTKDKLAYHKNLLRDPSPSLFKRPLIIGGGNPSNLKIPYNIGHVHVWKAYIDLKSSINIMTRMHYNWIMKRQLGPRIDPKDPGRISNFTGRTRGMHIFVGNFTYVVDFLIVEDISLVIDPCLLQVVLGEPFVETSNMIYDSSLGIVKFTNGIDEVAYKMPHKIEQFQSLSNMKKEHKQSVYFRNKEDMKRGMGYVMEKIFGFYKECLELGHGYKTNKDKDSSVNDVGVT
ncbi:hypothetical protein Tco_0442026 [Tanacetum coccineum]